MRHRRCHSFTPLLTQFAENTCLLHAQCCTAGCRPATAAAALVAMPEVKSEDVQMPESKTEDVKMEDIKMEDGQTQVQ